jgi:hypothetical protein
MRDQPSGNSGEAFCVHDLATETLLGATSAQRANHDADAVDPELVLPADELLEHHLAEKAGDAREQEGTRCGSHH